VASRAEQGVADLMRHRVGEKHFPGAGAALGQILDAVDEDHRMNGKSAVRGLSDETQVIGLMR
jgi:hypothetical protein